VARRRRQGRQHLPRAGHLAQPSDLVDVAHLVTAYYTGKPDPDNVDQQVAFGTSGHRGSSLKTAFNEDHILATTQAICDYRRPRASTGRCSSGATPTGCPSRPGPARSRCWSPTTSPSRRRRRPLHADPGGLARDPARQPRQDRGVDDLPAGIGLADGIVVTPSHNPPSDGGFKYNPPHGGPADSDATKVIAARANELHPRRVEGGQAGAVHASASRRARHTTSWAPTSTTCPTSSTSPRSARPGAHRRRPARRRRGRLLGCDRRAPRLDLTVVNPLVDPTWRFMTLDWDGKIRMDCSSPSAMASLIANATPTTSRPATTPTPTGTASSPRTAA
jgi:phosphoglucomutase